VRPLVAALKTEDPAARGLFAEALCRVGKDAVPVLREELESGDPEMRQYAALVLWQMGEEGIGALFSGHED